MRAYTYSSRGITLISATVGMAVLSVAATVMFWMLSQASFDDSRLERKLKGGRMLARFALEIQSLPPEGARTLCLSPDRFSNSFVSPCPAADGRTIQGLSGTDSPNPNSPPIPLDRALDWNGDPLGPESEPHERKLCISIISCKDLANQQLMEIELAGYWITPSNPSTVTESRIKFRKIR